MLDLHEGVLEIFVEGQAKGIQDWENLRSDTWVAHNLMFERTWFEQAVRAPGQLTTPCPLCGSDVVERVGSKYQVHMGQRPVTCGWLPGNHNKEKKQ